ncbi:MAG TPA: polyprenol phosphomannose-dependent alpha 1,6 mannosyltransferase MptB [Acidimicrobiales bacterium]|nr:polyprenol phosphomannose-dependent alpha 1,6 mannosyltransferase MptB [Acidimicrobiales bacterium]
MRLLWADPERGARPAGSDAPADVDPEESTPSLTRPAILGFLATTAITIGASQPASPFTLKQPDAWFFGIPDPGGHAEGLLLSLVLVFAGMLVLSRVWYDLARALRRHRGVPVAKLAVIFAVWVLPLLVAPPLFSRDVYSYAAQGEMVTHGITPYQYGPSTLGAGPFVTNVDPLWGNAPAPYGPVFLRADGLLVTATAHNPLATVVGLRLMALVGVILLAVFVPKLAEAYGRDPGSAFTLAVLNPITLLHLIGGAHNDALMLGLLVAGVALAKRGRPVLGIVVCTLAAAIKVPAAVGILYVGWDWLGTGVPWRERVRPLLTAGLIAGGVMAVLAGVTGMGWGWVTALGTPDAVRSMIAPTTFLGTWGGHLFHWLGVGPSPHSVLSMARALGLAAAAVTGVFLFVRSRRIGNVQALALTLLAIVLLGPVVQPWYVAWGLIVLAPVAAGRLWTVLIGLSIGVSFLELPGARLLLDELSRNNVGYVLLSIAALLVTLAVTTPFGAAVGRAWRLVLDRTLSPSPVPQPPQSIR